MGKGNIFTRMARLAENRGGKYLLWGIWENIWWRLEYMFRLLIPRPNFSFGGVAYPYFWHFYTVTWKNERSVEIPIFQEWMENHRGKSILEVGNVLAHYFPASHDIVDKYEKAPGIINEDIVDFRPDKTFDLIICISTLEHVGWDEEKKDPAKPRLALDRMRELLAPGGTLALSFPLGHNPHLDKMLEGGEFPLTERFCFKRRSRCAWDEVRWEDIRGARSDDPIEGVNGLVIGIWSKPPVSGEM